MGIHRFTLVLGVTFNSTITNAPKKRFKTNATSISQAHAARGNSNFPHVVNKYNIAFLDNDHVSRYIAIVNRKISAPGYFDEQMLTTLHLFDNLRILLARLGWVNFMQLQEPIDEYLVWEFMSSLVVDLNWEF